jgi:hypothetical protein
VATQPFINSLGLLVIGAVLTFVAARYWHLKNQAIIAKNKAEEEAARIREGYDRLRQRVAEIENNNVAIKAAVQPITTAFQALLIKN